jgi:hypothetical protein
MPRTAQEAALPPKGFIDPVLYAAQAMEARTREAMARVDARFTKLTQRRRKVDEVQSGG